MYNVAGIVTGILIWAICFFGITIMFHTLPFAFYLLKISGDCYLVYLGLRLVLGSQKPVTKEAVGEVREATPLSCFQLGLYTNLLNPKTAVFILSLFIVTISPVQFFFNN